MLRLLSAATLLSIGTVLFLALAVPRLYTGIAEHDVRATLQAVTPGETLDEAVAAALEEDDLATALMYAHLANDLNKPIAPALQQELEDAQAPLATFLRNAGDFAGAYITGNADSSAGLAGAIVSDLTVVGDVRDIITEGGKAAVGEDYSRFLLTLAAVGIAAEGVTIATGGGSLVVKAGISMLKVAKRTGNLTVAFSTRLVRLARAATAPSTATVARAPGGPVTDAMPSITGAAAGLTRSAARAELRTTLGAVNTMAANAGGANAVRLMRRVRTVGNATDLAAMSGRFGRSTRAVVELTGKTALRGFRVALRGAKMLIAFLYSFLAWLAGLLVLGALKQIYRAFMWTTRGLVFAFWVP
ncbi:MAG: hypothetical protein AAF580_05215 [Pseudomonadota bacterium]